LIYNVKPFCLAGIFHHPVKENRTRRKRIFENVNENILIQHKSQIYSILKAGFSKFYDAKISGYNFQNGSLINLVFVFSYWPGVTRFRTTGTFPRYNSKVSSTKSVVN